MAEILMTPNWPSAPTEASGGAVPAVEGDAGFALPALSYVQPPPDQTASTTKPTGDPLTRWLETVLGLTAQIGDAVDPAIEAMDATLPPPEPITAPEEGGESVVEAPPLDAATPAPAPADIDAVRVGPTPAAPPAEGEAAYAADDLPPVELDRQASDSPNLKEAPVGPADPELEKSHPPAVATVPSATTPQVPERLPTGQHLTADVRGMPTATAAVVPVAAGRSAPIAVAEAGENVALPTAGPRADTMTAAAPETALPTAAVVPKGASGTVPAGQEAETTPPAASSDSEGEGEGAIPGSQPRPATSRLANDSAPPAPGAAPVPRDMAQPPRPDLATGPASLPTGAEPQGLADGPRQLASASASWQGLADAGQATHPRPVIRQMTEALVTTRADRTEIALSPEELGRLRVIMSGPDRSHITIWAERPETLDLVRRNADLLTQQLAEAGVTADSLSFHRDDRTDRTGPNAQGPADDDDTPTPPDAIRVRLTPAPLSDRRLDIRI